MAMLGGPCMLEAEDHGASRVMTRKQQLILVTAILGSALVG